MKIIVLGASGQIGSIIFDGLKNDHDVIGTSRKSGGRYIRFDPFSDDWKSLGKADVLVNCVGQIEATTSSSFYHIHVELTKVILSNRKTIGNPRIIQISALGASTTHQVEFLKTKGLADDLLLQYSNTVIVRPSIVCTHRTMIVKKMLMLERVARYTGGVMLLPRGIAKTRIQPVLPHDLLDVVRALSVAVEPRRIVNVVGPLRLSFLEIITMMQKTRNKKLRMTEIPKVISSLIVSYCIGKFFPGIINSQQYQLLFYDNIADQTEAEEILQRQVLSPEQFFINEFKYTSH